MRSRIVLVGLFLATGCGVSHASITAPPARPHELLFARSLPTLNAIDVATGRMAWSTGGAVAAPDWSRLVWGLPTTVGTDLVTLDPATGHTLTTQPLTGSLVVRAVAHDGAEVALVPTDQALRGGYLPLGHATTTVIVASPVSGAIRQYPLDGNFAPEAFSLDGQTLFVIQYVPPTAPTGYQVRQMDLRSGQVSDVLTADKDLQKAMGGTARTQVLAPGGHRLYTLYTQTEGSARRAFVHVLDLDHKLATCVDLPATFGSAPDGTTGLAVSPDGNHLYVATTSGVIADLDTVRLSVTRTVTTDPTVAASPGDPLVGAAAAPGQLFLAASHRLAVIDTTRLSTTMVWPFSPSISALQVDLERGRLWIGLPDRIASVDPANDREVAALPVANVTEISHIGLAPPPLDPGRGGLQCAC
ncbi:MAG TPA: hypothetical protein VLL25_07425 [Acidimicrobiales bacterium]|nr:hypothetical protein [Acidimicrobiales bacterium]